MGNLFLAARCTEHPTDNRCMEHPLPCTGTALRLRLPWRPTRRTPWPWTLLMASLTAASAALPLSRADTEPSPCTELSPCTERRPCTEPSPRTDTAAARWCTAAITDGTSTRR